MSKERFGVVFFLFLIFIVFIIFKVVVVTLVPDEKLISISNETLPRGKILDRNGKELAVNTTYFSLYARPKMLTMGKKETFYNELIKSGIFNSKEAENIFLDKNFVWLKRKMTRDEANYIRQWLYLLKEKKIIKKDELGLTEEVGRFYPYKELSHIVGNVNIDNKGISGLELSFDRQLSMGSNIQTTIDVELSFICYHELLNAIEKEKAESGSVVVINSRNFEILSIVSIPSYDPNSRIKKTTELFFPAAGYTFEPGSIMKIFSMAFALERRLISLNSQFYCPGNVYLANLPFSCLAAHGYVTPEKIIQKSCNVGMVQIADRFDKEGFYSFLSKFGFGKLPEIEIPGSSQGILRNYKEWSLLSKYMISIGQEIGVTALQLAVAGAIIANRGNYIKPSICKIQTNYQKATQIISGYTAGQILSMMKKVISEEGTAISAKIEGIEIAGKTGTGQVAIEKGGGYYKDLYNAVFIGFLPASDPEFVILVVIHKPRAGRNTGGVVAAPVFANIVRKMILNTHFVY